jgi:polysaccharide export outer membrane protein
MGTDRFFRFLVVLLCVFVAAPVFALRPALAQESSAAIDQSAAAKNPEEEYYRIDVGDALEINVWDEPELTRSVTVRLDGRISLPLVGDVMAAGTTPMELAAILEEKIGEIVEEPTVTVIVTASNSRVYYMVGEIGPGQYQLNTPITLLQAIAKAGGLGEWADRDEIMIVRRVNGRDVMLNFDYDKFIKGKDLSQNIFVQYGDTIVVF